MKYLLLSFLFLFTGLGLAAQCDDFSLLSVDCSGDEQVFSFTISPPADWFGETQTYLVDVTDPAQRDTLMVGLTIPVVSASLGAGTYEFIVDRVGLCTQVVVVVMPDDCDPITGGFGTVSGRTWFDANKDGIRQLDEVAVPAVVFLEDGNGNPLQAGVSTGTNGAYEFNNVPSGVNLSVRFEPSTDDALLATQYRVTDDATVDNDMQFNFYTAVFTLAPDQTVSNLDGGFISCDLSVTVDDATVLCGGNCDGELTANATGGNEPYTYLWSNGATGQTITGLCPGNLHTVTVISALGCEASTTGTVIATAGFDVSIDYQDTSCDGVCDGEATVTVTGGTAPYAYDWSRAGDPFAFTTQVINLCSDVYRLTVTDATGCSIIENFSVGSQPGPEYDVVISNPISCAGGCDGALTVLNPTDDPIFVTWPTGDIGETLTGLCAGTYTAFVTTNDNCFTQVTGTILDPEPISLSIFADFLSCGDGCIGELTVTATGGTTPYTYSWNEAPFSSDPTGTGLCPGGNSIVVTDANGCTATAVGFVNQENNLTARVLYQGGDCDADGGPFTSRIDVVGGTAPFSYTFTSEFGTETTDQADGWPDAPPFTPFDIEVIDAEGCSTTLFGFTRERIAPLFLGDLGTASSCNVVSDFLNAIISLPVGMTELVLPGGEVVPYVPGTHSVVNGEYELRVTSEDETCLSLISFSLFLDDLPDEIVVVYNGGGCADQSCFILLSEDQVLIASNLEVIVTTPSNQVITSNEPVVCGLTEAGVYMIVVSDGCTSQTIFTEAGATPACGSISGTLYSTPNTDCGPVPGAATIPFTIIRIIEPITATSYFAVTDENGYYSIAVPADDYLVAPLVNGSLPDYACAIIPVTVAGDDAVTADIYTPGELMCPEMDVDISMWNQRRCFENSLYLYYYNSGNVTAPDAVLTVELDEYYTDITADYPFTQVGQTLIFELGDVPFCQFGYITVNFTISCEAPLGETHCVNASITPDGFCGPSPFWNGSLVNITEAFCDGDSVRFIVENVGINPTSAPLSYVVVEDGIMMTTQPVITEILDPAEQFEIALLADGSVFQLITNQEPGAPTTNDPSFLVDGCGDNPTLGFSNIQSLGNGVPWQETICLENSGSWDPNDKTGYPIGHTGNMIAPGTRLDYNIRFQNTGTDTAFTVVIRDTIGQALDLSTFRVGASSHRYRMTIDTNRVLTFVFDDIQLVDSMTNPLGSQGMVSFSIDHNPGLEPGDLIENKAAIYFDFNEPIITNVSTHMIETKSLPTSLRTLLAQSTAINVFPNPVTDRLSIRLPEAAAQRGQHFVVTDLYGRDLGALPAARFEEGLSVANLPNGYYFLTLVDAAGRAQGRTGFVVAH